MTDKPRFPTQIFMIWDNILEDFYSVNNYRPQSLTETMQLCEDLNATDDKFDFEVPIYHLGQENDWEPIETAPKDKNRLLLGWNPAWLHGKGVPCIMIWAKHLASNKMCWMDFGRAYPIEPTHWMPAPTTPFRESEQSEL